MKINEDLSYFLGVFAADGSLYYDSYPRCEIVDGSSIAKEQEYSYQFIESIAEILSQNFDIHIKVKQKGNAFLIKFRKLAVSNWLNEFGFKSGNKTKTVSIPQKIKNTCYEKAFWLGVMDSDGMIGRNTKNITLWSASKRLCIEFHRFLLKNDVLASFQTRIIDDKEYYCVKIKSSFVRKYSDILGFRHPRKKIWLERHLRKDFFVQNRLKISDFLINKRLIDYAKIFDERVFIINGEKILKRKRNYKNMKFQEIFNLLSKQGMPQEKIYTKLNKYKWKLSKGSTTSIRLPLYFTKDFENISKFVRITNGGIRISKTFIMSYQQDPDKIARSIEKMFCIKPIITAKNELIYDSGVLNQIFTKVLVKENEL